MLGTNVPVAGRERERDREDGIDRTVETVARDRDAASIHLEPGLGEDGRDVVVLQVLQPAGRAIDHGELGLPGVEDLVSELTAKREAGTLDDREGTVDAQRRPVASRGPAASRSSESCPRIDRNQPPAHAQQHG
jgi:hypothetical protein